MSHARTLWEEGHEPGHRVVALAVAVALSAGVVDLTLTGRIGVLFDLCFVVLSVAVALLVRHRDFFTVGVLPPLVMLVVFVLIGATTPAAIAAAGDNVVQAVVSGLSHHSIALGIGYGLCLVCLAIRERVLSARRAGAAGSPSVQSWLSRSD